MPSEGPPRRGQRLLIPKRDFTVIEERKTFEKENKNQTQKTVGMPGTDLTLRFKDCGSHMRMASLKLSQERCPLTKITITVTPCKLKQIRESKK